MIAIEMNSKKKSSLFGGIFAVIFGFRITNVFGETVVWNTANLPFGHACLRFDGWTSHEREILYHHDVSYLFNAAPHEIERRQDPSFENWPAGMIAADLIKGGKREEGKPGTLIGTGIRVVFDPKRVSLEKVIKYFGRVGVRVAQKGEVVFLPPNH